MKAIRFYHLSDPKIDNVPYQMMFGIDSQNMVQETGCVRHRGRFGAFRALTPRCISPRMKVPMALSDEERRRLERLEKELAAEHPDLARKLQSGFTSSRSRARIIYGVMGALAGFAVVVAGIITKLTLIGVIGFLLMVASGYWFLSGIFPYQDEEPP
ncbi:DUF3040 domain-containing protein [Arthrobacter sp. D1-17]